MTFDGRLYIGELDGHESARVRELKKLLDGVGVVVVSDNIMRALWSKLPWNCAVSALCAISGKLLGELLEHAGGRILALSSYREALDTAAAQAIRLERVAVDHDPFYLVADADDAARKRVLSDSANLTERFQGVKPSTLGSLERGRKSEIARLNGYLVEAAKRAGIEAPLNSALTAMVLEIEAGTRSIDPRNLSELMPLLV